MSLKLYCLFPLLVIAIDVSAALPLIGEIIDALPQFIAPEALDLLRSTNKISEFIKHLGIPNEELCFPDTDETVDPMFHEELDFGDLLMNKESEDEKDGEDEEGEEDDEDVQNDYTGDKRNSYSGGRSSWRRRKYRMRAEKPKKWVNGIVPYHISIDFNSRDKQKIRKAIKEMNSKLRNVHFRPVKKSDKNYIIIYSGKGCYAQLGMRGGQQAVSLQSNKCLRKGTIQHELLHVLGFRHEQNRPDRNSFVKVLYENIPEKWHKDYQRYRTSEANAVGTYDYYSVLHYPLVAPNSKGRKLALEILDDSVDLNRVGERQGISKWDLKKAEELYSDESDDE